MSTPWVVAFVLLTLLVVVLTLLVLGLLRQSLQVMRRLELTLGPPTVNVQDGPGVGSPAPALLGSNGFPTIEFSAASSWSLVLFLEAGCEPCQVLAHEISHHAKWQGDVRRILVVDHAGMAPDPDQPWLVHLDPTHVTADFWSVKSSPFAFMVDREGLVRGAAHPNSLADLERLRKSTIATFSTAV